MTRILILTLAAIAVAAADANACGHRRAARQATASGASCTAQAQPVRAAIRSVVPACQGGECPR